MKQNHTGFQGSIRSLGSAVSFLAILLSLTCWTVEGQERPGRGEGGFGRGRFGGGNFGGGFARGQGLFGPLGRESVQTELELTPDQLEQIQTLSESIRGDRDSMRERFLEATTPEARQELIETIQREAEERRKPAEEELKKLLSADQLKRLQQLELQAAGIGALTRDDVAGELKVSDEQKTKIQELMDEFDAQSRELGFRASREEREELRLARDEAIQALLTEEQRTLFEEKKGPALAVEPFVARSGPNGPTVPPEPVTRPMADAEAPDSPEDIVADLSSSRAVPEAEASAEEHKMSFNFRFAPWELVLKHFADEAKLTLDLNLVPPGTFNYYDRGEYTATEALDILNGYLLQKGFLLVRRDKFLVVVNVDQPIPPNLIPQIPLSELESRGRNELLRVVIPIPADGDAAEAATEVEALLGPQGKVVPLSTAKRLVVTDIGSNLRRINELLNGNGDGTSQSSSFRSFELKHILASDAERIVRDLFGLSPRGATQTTTSSLPSPRSSSRGSRSEWYSRYQQAAAATQQTAAKTNSNDKIKVTVDVRTNRLLVTADAEQLAIVEEAIRSIDVDSDGAGRSLAGFGNNTPQLEVYPISSADIKVVVQTITSLVPGIIVNEDSKANRINVFASPAEQQEVKAIIRQLDGANDESVTVIPLSRLDAAAAANSLKSLFTDKNQTPPTIEADVAGSRLMIRGSADQIAQIRSVLLQLGEDGTGLGIASGSNRGPIRTLNLGGRDPREMISLLQQLWPANDTNPIRVVVPSAISPNMRSGGIQRRFPGVPESDSVTPHPLESIDPTSTESEDRGGLRPVPTSPAVPSEGAAEDPAEGNSDEELEEELDDVEDLEVGLNEPKLDATELEFLEFLAGAGEADELEQPAQKPAVKTGEPTPLLLSPSGTGLIIASEDEEALDRLEALIETLAMATQPKKSWTIFYLRSADATETATMLGSLFPSGSVSGVASPGSSTMMGSVTSSLGSLGGSLMDMTGLSSLTAGATTLRIIPEVRSNSLFVTGPADQVREVEDLLRILDAAELPESLRDRVPRMIEVDHADVTEVASVIEDVYQDFMTVERGAPQAGGRGSRGGGSANPLAMLMGAAQGGATPGRGIRLTLGVDTRTNTLIVSADDALFRQVEALVSNLDAAALEAKRTVRVVSLQNANSLVVQQALGSLLGKVKITTTNQPGQPQVPNTTPSSNSRTSRRGTDQSSGGNDAEVRQFFEQRLRERMLQDIQGARNPPGGADRGGAAPGGGDRGRGGFRRGGR